MIGLTSAALLNTGDPYVLFPEFFQDIAGDLFGHFVAPAESVSPVGRAAGKDGATTRVDTKAGVADAALLPLVVPLAVASLPLRGTRGEDFERLRRTITVCGRGQAIFPGQLASVALVANDRVLGSELIVPFEIRPGEDPVLGMVDLEGSLAFHELTVAEVVSTEQETHASQLIFGSLEPVITPDRCQRTEVVGLVDRIGV